MSSVAPRSPASLLNPALPQALVDSEGYIDDHIRRTRRSLKLVDAAAGILTLALGLLGFLLVAGLVDHWIVPGGLGPVGRMVMFGVLLVGIAWYAWRQFVPLLRSINPVYAAHTIEQSAPSLKNSLLNVLLFRTHRQDMSAKVYHALEQQAAQRLSASHADAQIDHRALLRLGYALVAITAICALYSVLSPKNLAVSAVRVLTPWTNIAPPSRVQITSVKPGDASVAIGERVAISAEISGASDDDPVRVHYSTSDEALVDETVVMTRPTTALHFTADLPRATDGGSAGVQQPMEYWIEAGDARSPKFKLDVFQRPTIVVQRVHYRYPDYTREPPATVDHVGDIRGIEGTTVTVEALASEPIKSAQVDFDGDGTSDKRMTIDGRTAKVSFTLELRNDRRTPWHLTYALRFTTNSGRTNDDPVQHRLDVQPDYTPEIRITRPEELELAVHAGDTVLIGVEARDPDYSLSGVRLVGRTVTANRSGEVDVLLGELLATEHAGIYKHLKPFVPADAHLRPGDVLEYWAEARDNRRPDANLALSERRTLRILDDNAPADPQQNNHGGGAGEQQQGGEGGGEEGQEGAAGGQSGGSSGESDSGEGQPGAGGAGGEGAGGESQQQENSAEGESQAGGSGGDSGKQPGEDSQGGNSQSGGAQSGGANSDNNSGASEGQQAEGAEAQQNEGGDSSQNGNASQQPGAGGQPGAQPGAQGSEGASAASEPVSSAGDQDAEAMNRISEHLQQQQPQEGATGEGASGEGASAEGTTAESAQHQQTPNNERTGANPSAPGESASADGAPANGASQDNATTSEQTPAGEGETPAGADGAQNETGGGSPAGDENAGQPGAPESSKKAPRKTEGGDESQSGAEPETAMGDSQGNRESDARGDQSGDRTGDGNPGGGQQAPNAGQGQPGSHEPSDTGANQSSDPGAGETGTEAGSEQLADGQTGKSSGNQAGEGSETGDAQGENPPSEGNGEPASAGGQSGTGDQQPPSESAGQNSGSQENGAPNEGSESGEGSQQSQENASGEQPGAEGQQPGTGNQGAGQSGSSQGNSQGAEGQQLQSGQPGASGQTAGAQGQQSGENPGESPSESASDGGAQPGGQSAGRQSPAGDQSQQKPPTGESASQGGSASNPPAGGTSGGGVNGDGVMTEPGGDDPNLAYARKQTELVLQRLDAELEDHKVDPSLLKSLGWSEDELRAFINRWKSLKAAAEAPGDGTSDARDALDQALRSLGLRPRSGVNIQGGQTPDDLRDLNEAARKAPAAEYADRVRAYLRAAAEEE